MQNFPSEGTRVYVDPTQEYGGRIGTVTKVKGLARQVLVMLDATRDRMSLRVAFWPDELTELPEIDYDEYPFCLGDAIGGEIDEVIACGNDPEQGTIYCNLCRQRRAHEVALEAQLAKWEAEENA